MLSQQPSTAVFGVTAVFPAAAGYATVCSGALPSPPMIASVNYAEDRIINNSVVTDINPSGAPDFNIYCYA